MEHQKAKSGPILLALDFDHTLIDANADLSLCKLSPGGYVPDHIQSLYSSRGFVGYMRAVFRHLHHHGVSAQRIEQHVEGLPLTPGMPELFEHIRSARDAYDVIILSDSNSVLIDTLLKHHELDGLVSEVFTNPAEYSDSGCLQVRDYHAQDWCSISTVNLCKGHILQEYIQSCSDRGQRYSSVVYVGDGANDLCPGLTLSDGDYLLPRKGFSLWNKLQEKSATTQGTPGETVKASVIGWESALEIRTFLQHLASGKAK